MKQLADAWNRFWFREANTSTLGAVRVLFGAVVLAWAISLAPDLFSFFSKHGMVPVAPPCPHCFNLLDRFPGNHALVVLYGGLLVAAGSLIVGCWSRLSALVVFVAVLSLERRNPFVFNSGDLLIRNFALFLALTPSGASLSVHRWRRARERFWEFPRRPMWALRLMQVQMTLVYGIAVLTKLRGTAWVDGTAVGYVLRLADATRFLEPTAVARSLSLVRLLTYATLCIEATLAVLVWNRRLRSRALVAGLILHACIELTLLVGFFSFALLVGYVAFVPPETMAPLLLSARDRLRRALPVPTRGAPAGA